MQLVKTTLLMAGLTGLFMGVGYLVGGQSGLLIALGFAAVSNVAMYWFSDSLVLKMQGAQPLGGRYPQVARIVADLASREGLPMPKLYHVATPVPNAFATGRDPAHAAVAVTDGIMQILSDDELRAVLAHEIGHVKNRDMLISTIAATVAGAISYVAQIALFFGGSNRDSNANPIAVIASALLAPLAAVVIQMAISRSREFMADEHSAHLLGTGRDLETALAKLENWKQHMPPINPSPADQATSHLMFANMFSGEGLTQLFSTHPSTKARIQRLKGITHH